MILIDPLRGRRGIALDQYGPPSLVFSGSPPMTPHSGDDGVEADNGHVSPTVGRYVNLGCLVCSVDIMT